MDLMYPHAIDRLRVVHLLLVAWRKSLRRKGVESSVGLTQEELARRSTLKDGSTISELESLGYLEQVAFGKKKPKSRRTLLKVLTLGLKRSQKDIDIVLWLYEGENFNPLQKNEVEFVDYLQIEQASQYTDGTELRHHVIDLLTDALIVLIPEPIKNDAKVQMIFDFHKPVRMESDQALHNLEHQPGQRLVLTKHPSYATYPSHIYDYSEWRGSYAQLSDEGKRKHRAVTDERRRIFLEHLKSYGERSIHPKRSLISFLQPNFKHSSHSHEERIEIVKHWIKLLETYKHYEVALAEEEPEFELAIKNTVGAFLSGSPGEIPLQKMQRKKQSIHYGPRYVQWCDKESIFAFFVDFERNWVAIPEQWRNKANVIEWLGGELSKSLKKRKPSPRK